MLLSLMDQIFLPAKFLETKYFSEQFSKTTIYVIYSDF